MSLSINYIGKLTRLTLYSAGLIVPWLLSIIRLWLWSSALLGAYKILFEVDGLFLVIVMALIIIILRQTYFCGGGEEVKQGWKIIDDRFVLHAAAQTF